jgi:hypothetical protein
MTGMTVGELYWYSDDYNSGTQVFNFSPRGCLAYISVSANGFGPGNAGGVISQYRQRQPDNSDKIVNFPGDYWDSPNRVWVPNCTSITFDSWINAGGYVVTANALTYW